MTTIIKTTIMMTTVSITPAQIAAILCVSACLAMLSSIISNSGETLALAVVAITIGSLMVLAIISE